MVQIKKETANIWEYKVCMNGNIANFVCLWKCQLDVFTNSPHYKNDNNANFILEMNGINVNIAYFVR